MTSRRRSRHTDKCQEVVILMKIYGTFCNLFCKLSRKKPRVNKAEPHVYSPPKQPSSPWRANKEKNRQRGMFARHQLATNSPWRVPYSPWRMKSHGRRARAVWSPQDDVAQTQWGRKLCSPWRATRTREAS